jgi:hypothetical protein
VDARDKRGHDESVFPAVGISPAGWGLTVIAMAMLWPRLQRLIDLWLMVVMWIWLFDIGLLVRSRVHVEPVGNSNPGSRDLKLNGPYLRGSPSRLHWPIDHSGNAGSLAPIREFVGPEGSGWVLSHSARALTIGLICTFSHHTGSSPQRWTSRW